MTGHTTRPLERSLRAPYAGATDMALLPLQTDPADLRRVWEVAAAF
jgi:hypothetical protein